MTPPRILMVRTDRLGDLVLATPVIRALRLHFPESHLAMMIQPAHRELIEGLPDLNQVILFDKKAREKSLWGMWRFSRRLRRERFDIAVILHSTNRVILAAWLAGIRRRVGYARRLGWLLTDRIPYVKPEGTRHEFQYNLDLLAPLGVPAPREAPLQLSCADDAERSVERFLSSRGVQPEERLVVLHPGASCPSKRWSAERFAAAADRLAQRPGVKTLVLTGPDEIAAGQAVLRRMRRTAIPAMGFFRVGELPALLKRAACLISNDSGPVHVAAAVGTPVVAIFGRWGGGLSPTRWGPVGERSLYLHRDVGCRPCLAHRCPIGFVCLDAITVEEVLAAVEHVLSFPRKGESNSSCGSSLS
ncbi:MAG: lipopolysaccharide heptosyltransferase II [Candidatus Omnitrophica bacterium]|nr:lipopolysaccharide heptosyltransferase II [Candidatus Omnitrophota bacterium]